MGKHPSPADIIVDLAARSVRNGGGPVMTHQMIPPVWNSYPQSFADNWAQGGLPDMAPSPNQVPRCGLSLQTRDMPNGTRFFDKSFAAKKSYFIDDAMAETECPTEDDSGMSDKCIQCFQPTYSYNYFCSHCGSGQDFSLPDYWENPAANAVPNALEYSQAAKVDYGAYDQPDFYSAGDIQPSRPKPKPKKSMVPRNSNPDIMELNPFPASGPTTLMIRNIPGQYTPEVLISEWPNDGTYDFLYLPYSSRMQRNLTYAFVNFTSPVFALEFKKKWQKFRLTRYTVQKPLNIGFADVQGRDENLRQLKKKRLLHTKVKQCQPLVFKDGLHMPMEDALAEAERSAEWTCQRFTV